MEAQFDVYSIITMFGIAQGLFLSVILLRLRRGNRRANRVLALLLFVISVNIFLYSIVQRTFLMHPLHFLIGWSVPIIFLFGPLYYLYVRILVQPAFRPRPRDALHLLPALACIACLLPFFLQGAAAKISYLTAGNRQILWNDVPTVAWLVSVVHVIVYIVSAKFPLYRYQRSIKEVYSNIDRINFRWLRIFIPFFSLCWYVILGITVIDAFILRDFVLNRIIPLLVTAGFFLFGYIGMLKHDRAPEPAGAGGERSGRKYRKSSLDEAESKRLLAALRECMERDKPYREPELTLPDLADRMGVGRNDLSQAINENTGSNFYDLVNGYRIEETKRLLAGPESRKVTLLALALEAGFNSKAAFNAAFKKHTGLTPSQYVKRAAAAQA